ncbi:hypothetical protein SO802_006541 [Lithocarpus litseifolius]|uniref:Uncharacterized protein n=1 Tax=Lithocarpus litseifolius TaxID=425828 RepID=A0AAW2DL97_9ROSI
MTRFVSLFGLLMLYMVMREDIRCGISRIIEICCKRSPADYIKLNEAKVLPFEIQSLQFKADFLRMELDSLEELTRDLKMWKKSYFWIENDRIRTEHKIYKYQAENYNLEKANKELLQQIKVFVGAMESVKALTRNADEEKRIAKIEGEKTEQSRLLPYNKD